MDESVTIARFPDAQTAGTAAEHLHKMGLDAGCVAVIRGVLPEDRTATATLVVASENAPVVVVEGFLVGALFSAIDAGLEGAPLLHATLRRVAVPERSALAYEEAVHHGAALLALRTPANEIERTCRALEAAGAREPTVHHFPSTRSPAS